MVQDPNNMRERALETATIVEDALMSISQNLKKTVETYFEDTDGVVKNLGKNLTREINSLGKVGDIIGKSYEKALDGSFKQADLAKIILQRNTKIFEIESRINILKALGNKGDKEALAIVKKLEKSKQEIKTIDEETNKELENSLRISNNISKSMGVTGDILKSSQNILNKLGLNNLEEIISEASDASLDMTKNLTNNGEKMASLGDKFKIFGAGAKTLFMGIGKSLIDPVFIFGTLVATTKGLISLSGEFLKEQSKIATTFNTSAESSKKIQENIRKSADINYSPDQLIEGYERYNKAVGLNLSYNEDNAKLMVDLVDNLGMSEEEAGRLIKTSLILGKSFKTFDKTITSSTNTLNKQNQTSISLSEVNDKIANSSEATRYNILGGVTGLARAAHTAARYGREMDEIVQSAESLLDFQGSLEKQMKAEMFLQKSINVQKLQYASLTGNAEEIAKEQARIINENWASTKGNVLAQQALAESIGLSKEQAAEIYNIKLKEAEILRKQGPQALKQYQDTLEAQKNQAQEAKKFDNALSSAINSLKTSLLPLVETITPLFIKMAEAISGIAKSLSGDVGKTIMGILGAVAGGGALFYGGSKLVKGFQGLKQAYSGGVSEDTPGTKSKGGLAGVLEKVTGKGNLGESANNPMYVYVTNMGGGIESSIDSSSSSPSSSSSSPRGAKPKGFMGKVANFAGNISKKLNPKQFLKGNIGKMLGKFFKSSKAMVGGILKRIPGIGPLIDLILMGNDIDSIISQGGYDSKPQMESDIGKTIIGSGLGMLGGGLAASVISAPSALGIPTALMAPLAYTGGDMLGRLIGESISDYIGGPQLGKLVVDNFASEGEAKKMATGGIVTKATNAIVGEAGSEAVIPLNEFYRKIDELIAVVKQGGNIYLDGKKVGTAMAMGSYRIQ
jgi:hypothetical protein